MYTCKCLLVRSDSRHVAAFHLTLSPFVLPSDQRAKDKDREKKKEKNKEWKNHKLPPVHDIARENGEAISPQKGRDVVSGGLVRMKRPF